MHSAHVGAWNLDGCDMMCICATDQSTWGVIITSLHAFVANCKSGAGAFSCSCYWSRRPLLLLCVSRSVSNGRLCAWCITVIVFASLLLSADIFMPIGIDLSPSVESIPDCAVVVFVPC